WGARIRTWDRGTKTRCLTAWLRPRVRFSLAAVAEEVEQPADREDDDGDDHQPFDDEPDDRRDHGQELRCREDPRELPHGVVTGVAPDRDVEEHREDGEPDHRPARDAVED